ncbi:riboflavin kinase / FMN adenylyltransferase [Anaerobranca californiensis DSM 14826]|jgi:riboflavin kinase/FMN adenylyltransferase|uniref:Riboflavin biosynthesis protein n=1 Tax=Anaerobranca californiensis DSM 14826 TaxID=1120989 RepID=A0A1M6KEG1_9FIRM|nr:bifunctional riboflavin kinase/FAD synthetase [Anaerobranca californiensis]SHJ57217.1 riboflavin kinase / FMN adenylyltransferase [Anaerobranca californiensis DSM 14826]
MKLIFGVENLHDDLRSSIVTIGNFDGLHVGHRFIIDKVINESKKENKKSVVLTFYPHPQSLFNRDFKIINPLEQKVEYFRETGIDYLIIQPFTKQFAEANPDDFVKDVLINGLKSSKVIIGYDFTFGNKGQGNIQLLQKYEQFDTEVVEPILVENLVVHSTILRNCLIFGDVQLYKKLTGKYPKISGHVTTGMGIGNKLGFPTANINFPVNVVKPARGVYLVKGYVGDLKIYGVANLGIKPTLGKNKFNVEVHLFDFNQDIYGQKITIELIKFLRPEKKFTSIENLTKQVKKDILEAKRQIITI